MSEMDSYCKQFGEFLDFYQEFKAKLNKAGLSAQYGMDFALLSTFAFHAWLNHKRTEKLFKNIGI